MTTGTGALQLRLQTPLLLLPLALFVAALALDLAGTSRELPELWTLGSRAAVIGLIVGGIIAVVQAVIFRFKWATALTLLGLALLGIARWLRGDEAVSPEPVLLGLQCLGMTGLLAGAVMARRAMKSQAVPDAPLAIPPVSL